MVALIPIIVALVAAQYLVLSLSGNPPGELVVTAASVLGASTAGTALAIQSLVIQLRRIHTRSLVFPHRLISRRHRSADVLRYTSRLWFSSLAPQAVPLGIAVAGHVHLLPTVEHYVKGVSISASDAFASAEASMRRRFERPTFLSILWASWEPPCIYSTGGNVSLPMHRPDLFLVCKVCFNGTPIDQLDCVDFDETYDHYPLPLRCVNANGSRKAMAPGRLNSRLGRLSGLNLASKFNPLPELPKTYSFPQTVGLPDCLSRYPPFPPINQHPNSSLPDACPCFESPFIGLTCPLNGSDFDKVITPTSPLTPPIPTPTITDNHQLFQMIAFVLCVLGAFYGAAVVTNKRSSKNAQTATLDTPAWISIKELCPWTFGKGSKEDELEEPAIWSLIERQPSTLWNLAGAGRYNGPDDDVSELDRQREMDAAHEAADDEDVSLLITVTTTSEDITVLESDNHAPATTPANCKCTVSANVIFVPRVTGWDGEDIEGIDHLCDSFIGCDSMNSTGAGLLDSGRSASDSDSVQKTPEVFLPHITAWAGEDPPEDDYSDDDSICHDSMDPTSVPFPDTSCSLSEDAVLARENFCDTEDSGPSNAVALLGFTPMTGPVQCAFPEGPNHLFQCEAPLNTAASVPLPIYADITDNNSEASDDMSLAGSTSCDDMDDEVGQAGDHSNIASANESVLQRLGYDNEIQNADSDGYGPSHSSIPTSEPGSGHLATSFSYLDRPWLGALLHELDQQLAGIMGTSPGLPSQPNFAACWTTSTKAEESLDYSVDMSMDTEFGTSESNANVDGESKIKDARVDIDHHEALAALPTLELNVTSLPANNATLDESTSTVKNTSRASIGQSISCGTLVSGFIPSASQCTALPARPRSSTCSGIIPSLRPKTPLGSLTEADVSSALHDGTPRLPIPGSSTWPHQLSASTGSGRTLVEQAGSASFTYGGNARPLNKRKVPPLATGSTAPTRHSQDALVPPAKKPRTSESQEPESEERAEIPGAQDADLDEMAGSIPCPKAVLRHFAGLGSQVPTPEHTTRAPVAPSTSSPAVLAFAMSLPPLVAPIIPRARGGSVSNVSRVVPRYTSIGHAAFTQSLQLPRVPGPSPTAADEPAHAEGGLGAPKKKRRSKASLAGQERRARARAEQRLADREE